MAGVVSEIAALTEGLRSLIKCEHLERQLSPPKYSGSSSEGDDFYSAMKSDSSKKKKEITNTPNKRICRKGTGQILIIERITGVSVYKKEKSCQTVIHNESPLYSERVRRKLFKEDPCVQCAIL